MKQKIIIFDFEVFAYDVLLGAYVINTETNEHELFQSWNLTDIKEFYKYHIDDFWIGHNNAHYDNLILQEIVLGKSIKEVKKMNDKIISSQFKQRIKIKLNSYDVTQNRFVGLKTLEAYHGKNISISQVDFNIDRELSEEEKKSTEKYNFDDLEQTLDNFVAIKGDFELRLNIGKEFGLDYSVLNMTMTQIAEKVLHAQKIYDIEDWVRKPEIFECLKLNHKDVIRFYLDEKYKTNEKLKFKLCDVEHTIGKGGLHGARKNYHTKSALYFDVSGYYNLVMINFNLLPRTIPDEYKELYKYMYKKQLELKKIDKSSTQRGVYKTILLSVFGASLNEYCNFYDPYHGELITIVGQIFLVDLLEKLEGKIELIQSNTDGIIAKPLEGISKRDIKLILDEWQQRTGFSCSFDEIFDIYQRDVNCYMYKDEFGNLKCLGDAVRHFERWKEPLRHNAFSMKEPPIITHCIVEYWMNKILPEDIVEKNKDNYKMFQYICNKNSFWYLELEMEDFEGNKTIEKINSPSRVFALNSDEIKGMVYKVKQSSRSKIASLPESVFVYDGDIRNSEDCCELSEIIDYDYYVKRAYEMISKFYDKSVKIKKVKL